MPFSPDLALLYQFADTLDLSPPAGAPGPTLDFTRGTDGTYYDAAGVLQTASPNVPRFDHDPTTLEPLGLLLEAEATNECQDSVDFQSAFWLDQFLLFGSTTEPDPFGTATASELTDDDDFRGSVSHAGFTADGEKTTFSVFLRKDAVSKVTRFPAIAIQFDTGGTTSLVRMGIDSSTGEFDLTVPTGGGTDPEGDVRELVGSQYWRVSLTFTNDFSGNTTRRCYIYPAQGAGEDLTGLIGVARGTITVVGAQIEVGMPLATSYIHTTGVAATRQADTCNTVDNSWYTDNGTTTWYAHANYVFDSTNVIALQHYQNTSTKNTTPTLFAPNTLRYRVLGAGTTNCDFSPFGGGEARHVSGQSPNDGVNYVEGGLGQIDIQAGNMPSGLDTLWLARDGGGAQQPSKIHIREIRYYNTRRPNSEPYTVPGTGGLEQLSLGLVPEEAVAPPVTLGYQMLI